MNDPNPFQNNPFGGADNTDATQAQALQAQIDRQRLLRAAVRMGLERPAAPSFESGEPLDAPARAAAFLVAIGPELSGQLLQRFSAQEAQTASSLLATVRSLPRDLLIEVLQQFKEYTENKREMPFDPGNFVTAVLGNLDAGADSSGRYDGIRANLEGKVPFYDVLCTIPADILHKYLRDEHPQLAATLLAILPTDMSARILKAFDPEPRVELMRRIGTLSPIDSTMLSHLNTWISDVVRKHVVESKGVEKADIGGVNPVVDILSSFSDKMDVDAIDELRKRDPSLAAKVEARMFFFDDFAALDPQYLAKIVNKVPRDTLAIALKGCSESMQEKFLGALTQRAANQVRFEMERMAAPRVSDIEEKQREMVRVARGLEQQREVVLDRKASRPGAA